MSKYLHRIVCFLRDHPNYIGLLDELYSNDEWVLTRDLKTKHGIDTKDGDWVRFSALAGEKCGVGILDKKYGKDSYRYIKAIQKRKPEYERIVSRSRE